MAINDFLSNLLISVGLKTSERELLEKKISEHENNIRTFNDQFSEHIKEIEAKERILRNLKEKYNEAQGTVKKTYEAQLRSIMKELDAMKEYRDLVIRNLDKEKVLLRNRKLALENLLHPANPAEIEDVMIDKEDMIENLKAEDRSITELDGIQYKNDEDSPIEFENEQENDELNQQLNALLNDSAESDTEKTNFTNDTYNNRQKEESRIEA